MVWEAIPESNQPGLVPSVKNGQLVVGDQWISTMSAYATPLIIECEISPEAPLGTGEGFAIRFVPVEQGDAQELNRTFLLTPAGSSNGTALATFCAASMRASEIVFTHRWEKPLDDTQRAPGTSDVYRVALRMSKDHLDVTLNGHAVGVADAGVPYENFRIQLSGLFAKNGWRVRNFSVR